MDEQTKPRSEMKRATRTGTTIEVPKSVRSEVVDVPQNTKSPTRTGTTIEVPKSVRSEIIDLHEKSYGSRRIARRVGYSRRVVRRVLREEGVLPPEGQRPRNKLDPFRETIEQKVTKDLTVSRIYREIREMGYQGGRTILADYVRQLRLRIKPKPTTRVKRRFETRPGVETQIDWSPYWVPIAGIVVLVHALGCLLCASRKLFLYFFRDERQSTLLEGLAMAFEYFDGCTKRVVVDNMATAVLGRYSANGKTLWHERFLDFTRHYGFDPFACRVRDPDRKGKKEKSFRLVWDDFLKGSEFESFDDLNRRAHRWLDHTPEAGNLRVHGTTRRVPNEAWLSERELLIRLPHKRYPVYTQEVRSVDQDATLSIRGTCYNVPDSLANKAVAVRLFAEHFEVLDRTGRLAFSRRYVPDADKGKLVVDPTLYSHSPRGPSRSSERLDAAFLERFPTLAPLVHGLQAKMKSLAHVHISTLLRLANKYGQEGFVAAATLAQDHRRFDALAVQRILERDHDPLEVSEIAPLAGFGPALIGDPEPGSLEEYGHLDTHIQDEPTEPHEQEE
jgi:transposase